MFNHTIKISWNNLKKLVECLDKHKIKFDTDFLIGVDFDGSMYQLDELIKETGGVVKVVDEHKIDKNDNLWTLHNNVVVTGHLNKGTP